MLNIARFKYNNEIRWGIVREDAIFPLEKNYRSTAALLKDRSNLPDTIDSSSPKIEIADVTLLSPVTGNRRVICQGANYRQHMIESGMNPDEKSFNMFFNKSSASICASGDKIIKPKHVNLLDYEIELGLVIGKPITEKTVVTEENIWQYVAGVVITNDISARDIQIPETQFFKGKSYRTFCPTGPYLCLLDKDSIHYLHQLNLELTVNGETRQKDSSANLVFKPAETLTELSKFSDLETGDLVLTGTPSGCALQLPSPLVVKLSSLLPDTNRWKLFKKIQLKNGRYLEAGDAIEATIISSDKKANLGTQRNIIVDE